MATRKTTQKFSDHKLFWMSALALLLSITSLIVLILYIQQKSYLDRLVDETNMQVHMDVGRLKACYENDIRPCTDEKIQEFNKKNYGE